MERNEKSILTIGIPTYNRPESIVRTVRALLPQLNEKVVLEVRDNCSNIPVTELFTEDEKKKFSIIRNKANIGGDANIVGCIYHASTKWVWTLGDDDEPSADAVQTILSDIESHPNELYIKYGCKIEKETNTLKDVAELCKIRHFYPNLLFISVTVYNRDKFKNDFVHYYTNLSFMNGQVVFLLKHLEKMPDKCLFSMKEVVADHGMGDGWDYDTMIKRTIQFLNLFPNQKKLFSRTFHAGMAFMYYKAIFFSEKIDRRQRFSLFFYVIKRIGVINTIRYNYPIITEFLIHLLLPDSVFAKVKMYVKRRYYNSIRHRDE